MPRPNRRDHVLDVAVELVRRDGVTPTMEALAEASGMTRQALYHHFGRPHDLFLAMVERVGRTHGLDRWIEHIGAADDPDERLGRYVEFLGEYWADVAPIAVAFEHASRGNPQARVAWSDRMGGQRAVARSVVRRFEAAGRLRPVWTLDTATDVLWTLATPHHHQLLTVECGWTKQQYEHYLCHTIEQVVARPAA